MSIIFCSQDVERVLGLEQLIPNLSVICLNRNALSTFIEKKVAHLFCLEDYEPVKDATSTFDLLNHPLVQKFIKKISPSQANILVFKNIPKVEKLAQKKGWKLLNNPATFNQLFEDKINFVKECEIAGVQIPPSLSIQLSKTSYEELKKKLSSSFVVQFRRGHAGETTHFVNSKQDWENLLAQKGDFPARISKFIKGHTFTYNICITKSEVIYSNLMWQITGKKPFTVHPGGTCGVDMVMAKSFAKKEKKMRQTIDHFALLLKSHGYKGFLGVDFMLEKNTDKVYLIECNPRLTANISLNTQVELLQGRKPLIQCHVEAFLPNFKVKKPISKLSKSNNAKPLGAYFVLRNNEDLPVQLKTTLVSGKYKILNNENIQLVEEKTTSRAGLQLSGCQKNEFILHLEGGKSILSPNMKVATITSPFSVLNSDGTVKNFVKNVFKQLNFKTIYVHPADFWQNRYAKPTQKISELYVKPLKNIDKLSAQAKNRNRQSQLLQAEGSVYLLGEYEDFYLVKKWDGTLGWACKNNLKETKSAPNLELGKNAKTSIKRKLIEESAIAKFLSKYQDSPYLWGGLTPLGIDCSGFVQRYFLENFNLGLPKHSTDQMTYGSLLKSKKDLKNHDLIFLINKKSKIPHVGIYFNGLIWHACLSKNKVVSQKIAEVTREYKVVALKRIT